MTQIIFLGPQGLESYRTKLAELAKGHEPAFLNNRLIAIDEYSFLAFKEKHLSNEILSLKEELSELT